MGPAFVTELRLKPDGGDRRRHVLELRIERLLEGVRVHRPARTLPNLIYSLVISRCLIRSSHGCITTKGTGTSRWRRGKPASAHPDQDRTLRRRREAAQARRRRGTRCSTRSVLPRSSCRYGSLLDSFFAIRSGSV